MHLRLAAAVLAAATTVGASALAKDEWKTVTLRGEPGLTISIPAAAVDKPDEKDPDELMFFGVTQSINGHLVCLANRLAYSDKASRETFVAALTTERREIFCNQEGATVSGLSIAGSESFTHEGSQAAICTASYTDSSQKSPGNVRSQMVVAAPDKAYFLTCTVEDEDQGAAELDWALFWKEKVRHIQMSLHLPK